MSLYSQPHWMQERPSYAPFVFIMHFSEFKILAVIYAQVCLPYLDSCAKVHAPCTVLIAVHTPDITLCATFYDIFVLFHLLTRSSSRRLPLLCMILVKILEIRTKGHQQKMARARFSSTHGKTTWLKNGPKEIKTIWRREIYIAPCHTHARYKGD